MIKPDVLIKSNRKSLSLTVDNDGKLIVKAPHKMKLDEIFEFVEKKQKWIKEKQNKIVNILNTNKKILEYDQFGERVRKTEVLLNNILNIELSNDSTSIKLLDFDSISHDDKFNEDHIIMQVVFFRNIICTSNAYHRILSIFFNLLVVICICHYLRFYIQIS